MPLDCRPMRHPLDPAAPAARRARALFRWPLALAMAGPLALQAAARRKAQTKPARRRLMNGRRVSPPTGCACRPNARRMAQYFSGARTGGAGTPAHAADTRAPRAAGQAGARRPGPPGQASTPRSLTPEQRISAAILRWSLQREVLAEPFQDHNFLFNQLSGPHVRVVSFMTEQHPLRQPADVAAYLERLAQVDQRLDEAHHALTRRRGARPAAAAFHRRTCTHPGLGRAGAAGRAKCLRHRACHAAAKTSPG